MRVASVITLGRASKDDAKTMDAACELGPLQPYSIEDPVADPVPALVHVGSVIGADPLRKLGGETDQRSHVPEGVKEGACAHRQRCFPRFRRTTVCAGTGTVQGSNVVKVSVADVEACHAPAHILLQPGEQPTTGHAPSA